MKSLFSCKCFSHLEQVWISCPEWSCRLSQSKHAEDSHQTHPTHQSGSYFDPAVNIPLHTHTNTERDALRQKGSNDGGLCWIWFWGSGSWWNQHPNWRLFCCCSCCTAAWPITVPSHQSGPGVKVQGKELVWCEYLEQSRLRVLKVFETFIFKTTTIKLIIRLNKENFQEENRLLFIYNCSSVFILSWIFYLFVVAVPHHLSLCCRKICFLGKKISVLAMNQCWLTCLNYHNLYFQHENHCRT